MNYCTKCGNKLKKNSNFCGKCGRKIINRKQKKEINVEKYIINTGIFLILFSNFLFILTSFNKFSILFRVSFLIGEIFLFNVLSFLSKKNDLSHKAFNFLGIIFIPILLFFINNYSLVHVYFEEGAGLYVYLSLISLITAFIFYINNKLFKNKLYNILILFSLLLSLIFFIKFLDFNDNIILFASLFIILIFKILLNKHTFKKNTNFINNTINVMLIVFCPIISIFLEESSSFINMMSLLIYFINLYLFLNKDFIKNINFILISIPSIILINNIFSGSIINYMVLLLTMLLYLMSYLYKDNNVKNFNFLLTVLIIFILEIISSSNYKLLFILNLIIFSFINFIIYIDRNKSIQELLNLFLPINIYLSLYSLFKIVFNYDSCKILLISSVITFVVYLVFEKMKRKTTCLEVFYILYIFLSTFLINSYMSKILLLSNLLLWIFYLIINNFYKKSKYLNYILLAGTFLSLIKSLSFDITYIVIGSSILLFIYYELMKRKNNLPLLIGSSIIFLNLLLRFKDLKIQLIISIILLYIYSYLRIRKIDGLDWYKIIYTFLGFMLINKLILKIINPIVIVSILVLFIYIFILIVMYLSEKETNKNILLYSIVLLIPYYNLINNIFTLNSEVFAFILLPIIIYTLVIPEIININDKDNFVFIISIVLSLFTLKAGVLFTILSIIIFIIYMLYGLIKKKEKMVIFSLCYLIISLFVSFINIVNNAMVLLILMLLGTSLIIYTLLKNK